MGIEEIEAIYQRLQRRPFPEHPESDELDEWLLELAEVDGHFAGLCETALDGKPVDTSLIVDLSELDESLDRIQVVTPEDHKIYSDARDYLELLKQIRLLLLHRSLSGNVTRR